MVDPAESRDWLTSSALLPLAQQFHGANRGGDLVEARACIERCILLPDIAWGRLPLLRSMLMECSGMFSTCDLVSTECLHRFSGNWVAHDVELVRVVYPWLDSPLERREDDVIALVKDWLYRSNSRLTYPALEVCLLAKLFDSAKQRLWLDGLGASDNIDLLTFVFYSLSPNSHDHSHPELLRRSPFVASHTWVVNSLLPSLTTQPLPADTARVSVCEGARRQSMLQLASVMVSYRERLFSPAALSSFPSSVATQAQVALNRNQEQWRVLLCQLPAPRPAAATPLGSDSDSRRLDEFNQWMRWVDVAQRTDVQRIFQVIELVEGVQGRPTYKAKLAKGLFVPGTSDSLPVFMKSVNALPADRDQLHSLAERSATRREFYLSQIAVNLLRLATKGAFSRVLTTFDRTPVEHEALFSLPPDSPFPSHLPEEAGDALGFTFVVYESVGRKTLKDYRKSSHHRLYSNERDNLVVSLQLSFALLRAHELCQFSHNDFHSSNIQVVECKQPYSWCYADDTSICLADCYTVPFIIDYGRSSCVFQGEHMGPSEHTGLGIYSTECNPIADLYRLWSSTWKWHTSATRRREKSEAFQHFISHSQELFEPFGISRNAFVIQRSAELSFNLRWAVYTLWSLAQPFLRPGHENSQRRRDAAVLEMGHRATYFRVYSKMLAHPDDDRLAVAEFLQLAEACMLPAMRAPNDLFRARLRQLSFLLVTQPGLRLYRPDFTDMSERHHRSLRLLGQNLHHMKADNKQEAMSAFVDAAFLLHPWLSRFQPSTQSTPSTSTPSRKRSHSSNTPRTS